MENKELNPEKMEKVTGGEKTKAEIAKILNDLRPDPEMKRGETPASSSVRRTVPTPQINGVIKR